MISIILPTYKDAPHIVRAIESVLAQTRSDWELIIVDDGLYGRDVVEKYVGQDSRIVYIHNEKNLGIQQSLNRGLEKAKGEYVARIDDDDEWIDTNKLAKQIAYFENHLDCVLVGTAAILVDEKGKSITTYHMPETDTLIRNRILFKNCFLHSTVMMRRTSVQAVGGYPQSLETKHVEDYALWLLLGQNGTYANLSDITTALMVHAGSLTSQNRVVQVGRMRALARKYRHVYPGFFWGQVLFMVRQLGFIAIGVIPIPRRLLYWIQKIYKQL